VEYCLHSGSDFGKKDEKLQNMTTQGKMFYDEGLTEKENFKLSKNWGI
jgi:hypothetical protein